LQATGDLAALQAVLGHKTIEMTMRYSHLLTEHLHEAVAKAGTKLGTRTPVSVEKSVEHGKAEASVFNAVTTTYCWTATARLEKDRIYSVVAQPAPPGAGNPAEAVLNPLVSSGPVAQQDRAAVS
jgi:hypothetical protein